MSELISVIVPIYNVEEYLTDCLTSILNQTYQNIELLLIDDGSTDSSFEIVSKFKEKNLDKNIQIIRKENGGQSSARNLGIKLATGKFFIFVDSDDMIAPNHVEELYHGIIEFDVDVAMCKATKDIQVWENQLEEFPVKYQKIEGDFITLVNELYKIDYPSVSVWAKIYNRNIFEKIRFVEGIIYEDGIVFYELLDQITELVLVDSYSYYYRTAENSTTTSEFNYKNFDALEQNRILENFFTEKHPENLDHFYRKALNLNDFVAVKGIQSNNEFARKLVNEVYFENKRYAQNMFPRKMLYISKIVYYPFLIVMSKIFKETKTGNETKLKKIINYLVRK